MQTINLSIELFGIILLVFLILIFPSFKKLFILNNDSLLTKPERNKAIDFTRGIAMTAIVVIHIDSYFQFFHPTDIETYYTRMIANLSRFCVPAFILSSAFFLSYKGANLYWTGKLKSLFIPYVIIAVIGFFTKYPPFSFFQEILPKLLLGQVFQPYYYVVLLFQFYFLYVAFFKNISTWSQKKFVLVLVLSALINVWSNHFFPKTNVFFQTIEVISFTNFLFYFVLGLSAKRIFTSKVEFLEPFQKNKFYKWAILISILLYLIPVIYFTFTTKIEVSNHFLFYPIVCFLLITLLGLFFESKSLQTEKLFSIFCYIGENSLAVFLLHPMVIHLMHMFDPYYLGGFYSSYIITLVLNLVIPLAVWKFFFYFINRVNPKIEK
jgi:probable poly-beta-1,6-N-acetyl-D-glucosamine export protein